MNGSAQPKTLDAAKQRIRALEQQLAARGTTQPGQSVAKTAVVPEAPKISDLTGDVLQEALSIASRSGDSAAVKLCYDEINRRRSAK